MGRYHEQNLAKLKAAAELQKKLQEKWNAKAKEKPDVIRPIVGPKKLKSGVELELGSTLDSDEFDPDA